MNICQREEEDLPKAGVPYVKYVVLGSFFLDAAPLERRSKCEEVKVISPGKHADQFHGTVFREVFFGTRVAADGIDPVLHEDHPCQDAGMGSGSSKRDGTIGMTGPAGRPGDKDGERRG